MADQLFNLDATDYKLLANAIADVRKRGILLIYRDIYRHMRQQTADRYRRAAKETAYARASLGTRQTVSGKIRGKGAQFGIDSGALFRQITQNVKIDDRGIFIYSDLAYSARIMELFARKGPFAPDSPLFVDETDLSVIGGIIAERVQKAVEDRGATVGGTKQ